MNTPVADFVRAYAQSGTVRLHMPGHKGVPFVGCEPYDITEIAGADALYEADGILRESEENASRLFGSAATLYSTEGSSQCIRAMVWLAAGRAASPKKTRPWFLAARNAHRAFLYALALADADVEWLWPQNADSLCSCAVTPEQVEDALCAAAEPPAAVYVTSPDYLGGMLPVREIAAVCHRHAVPLLVDNAHGAYLRFLPESLHPMDCGADLCCDSAHKTLPVLTGGAYLHIGAGAPPEFAARSKTAMAVFGSTSPSYLTLASLDLANRYLDGEFREKLEKKARECADLRQILAENGWETAGTEPLKLTLRCPAPLPGPKLAERLRGDGIECEYAEQGYLVFMISAETKSSELRTLAAALGRNTCGPAAQVPLPPVRLSRAMTVREAVFAPQERIPAPLCPGRVSASPAVSCPPAIPIAVPGEILNADAAALFARCGIREILAVKE